jgi:hypothetical protein
MVTVNLIPLNGGVQPRNYRQSYHNLARKRAPNQAHVTFNGKTGGLYIGI